MDRPEVSDAAEELYAFLEAYVELDKDTDWTTLQLCEAIVGGDVQRVFGWVTDDGDQPGWAVLVDAQTAEAEALPWLAQLNGTVLTDSMTEQQRRDSIEDPSGFDRGGPEAFAAAPKPLLTGTQKVYLDERFEGDAYKARVRVLAWETPDPDSVLDALIRQKPGGIVLTFEVIEGQDWNDVKEGHVDWNAVDAAYADWDAVRVDVP